MKVNTKAESAKIGNNTIIGDFSFIGEDVVIGENCIIGIHVVIKDGTVIGNGVQVGDFCCLGCSPVKALNSAVTRQDELPPAKIGNGVRLGISAIVYKGAKIDNNVYIADLATVRERVSVGEASILGRGVSVECDCSVGRCCKIETGAYITAYSVIEDYCFIAPGVITSNDNFAGRTKERFSAFKGLTLKKGGRIGAGAVILPGKTIGEEAFVAAGSVVTKDVAPRALVMGNPAKYIRDVDENQLLINQDH